MFDIFCLQKAGPSPPPNNSQRDKRLIRYITLVESSIILVCSAMKRTQMHDLCISGGHLECEKVAEGRSIGLLESSRTLLAGAASGPICRSSQSACSGRRGRLGPWMRQLPPKRAPSVRLGSTRKQRADSSFSERYGWIVLDVSFFFLFKFLER